MPSKELDLKHSKITSNTNKMAAALGIAAIVLALISPIAAMVIGIFSGIFWIKSSLHTDSYAKKIHKEIKHKELKESFEQQNEQLHIDQIELVNDEKVEKFVLRNATPAFETQQLQR